tara:strand:- start:539 stop:1873 length:1335 start_codon:yes stop_codon:yes gene_type:complete
MSNLVNIPEYKVSQFNKIFKELIEINFNYIRIKGEISEIKQATKGQLYITLKDGDSILSGVIWETKKKFLQFNPEEGMEVIVTGKITTWSRFKTTYQIDIDKLEIAGEGVLLKLIEDRKNKLKKRGIFDETHKKKIPYLPKKIGVITSPTGSVIHDIINRIKDRFPTNIDIWPVSVQGATAADSIIKAIEGFHLKEYISKPEVIIIARGGGSTEDLMAFNDERLALAVFNSTIPVISAIGHETDTTIIDYVSDLRASTPTAAAEKAVPVSKELKQNILSISQKLNYYIDNIFNNFYKDFIKNSQSIKAPNFIISVYKDKLSMIVNAFSKNLKDLIENNFNKLDKASQLIRLPNKDFQTNKINLQNFYKNLNRNMNNNLEYKKKDFNKLSLLLNANSINSALSKGYSIVSKSNKIIKKSNLLNENDLVKIQFSDKSVNLSIKKIN